MGVLWQTHDIGFPTAEGRKTIGTLLSKHPSHGEIIIDTHHIALAPKTPPWSTQCEGGCSIKVMTTYRVNVRPRNPHSVCRYLSMPQAYYHSWDGCRSLFRGDVTFWKRSCFAIADAISKRRCDFKTQMRFHNADAISKRRCDFKTQMRFQNADAISKRRCDFKTQMRLQDPWVPVLRM